MRSPKLIQSINWTQKMVTIT